jgi:hypothetical protein
MTPSTNFAHVINANYNEFASAFAADMPLNDATRWDWDADGAIGSADSTGATSDNILTWAGSGYTPYYYRKTTAGTIGWCKTGKNVATTDKIPLGAGAWYLRRGTATVIHEKQAY